MSGILSKLFKSDTVDPAAEARRTIDPDYLTRAILELPDDAFGLVIAKIRPPVPATPRDLRAALFPGIGEQPLRSKHHPLLRAWLYRYTLDTSGVVWLDFNSAAIDTLLARPDLLAQLRTHAESRDIPHFL